MTAFNDSFFFAHAMEIRLLLAIGAIVTGFVLIKIATLVGNLAHSLRLALNHEHNATRQLSALGAH